MAALPKSKSFLPSTPAPSIRKKQVPLKVLTIFARRFGAASTLFVCLREDQMPNLRRADNIAAQTLLQVVIG
jgi:hypothetical protein